MGLWPAHPSGARRSALIGGVPPASSFEAELYQHEGERHQRIVTSISAPLVRSRLPAGWRAEDLLGQDDGFVPLAEAARAMGLEEAEIVDMVRAGLLEASGQRIRPALVTVLTVRDER